MMISTPINFWYQPHGVYIYDICLHINVICCFNNLILLNIIYFYKLNNFTSVTYLKVGHLASLSNNCLFSLVLRLRVWYNFIKTSPIYFNVKIWCCEAQSFQTIWLKFGIKIENHVIMIQGSLNFVQ